MVMFFSLLSLIMQFSKNKLTEFLFSFSFSFTEKSKRSSLKIKQNIEFSKVSCFPEELPSGRLPRKEVIQPQVLLRLPCYDFTPIADPTFGRWFLTVTSRTSGIANSHGVTGGVYKARERIHRDMLIRDY